MNETRNETGDGTPRGLDDHDPLDETSRHAGRLADAATACRRRVAVFTAQAAALVKSSY
jgi:hypothetical protein